MFFLNLSAFEFLALLGTLGSAITALYLLDRRKRRRVVSTLRFWSSSVNVEERRSRRHMQQPFSLLLQLLSLLLLLLAIARLQWGSRPQTARDHVFLVDTSAWSGAAGVLDEERNAVRSLLRAIPATDRALIVSTSALVSTPEAFTADRRRWNIALSTLRPGASALDLDKAVTFAQAAQRWSGHAAGSIIYAGPARTDHPPQTTPGNLRVIKVAAPEENVGIRAASARRTNDGGWDASFTLRNDGSRARTIHLQTGFAGTAFASRRYTLAPQSEVIASYNFVTRSSGLLKARIEEPDALIADNSVQLNLHDSARLGLRVVTRRRDRLSPLIAPDLFSAEYVDPAQYRDTDRAGVWIFDQYAPPRPPRSPALYLNPPHENAPLPTKESTHDALLSSWNTAALGDNGLRTHELRFASADVFELFKGDTPIASVPQGAVIAARNTGASSPKFIAVGFDLLSDAYRTDLTTPLLMAYALSWLAPSSFHSDEFLAMRAGALSLPLESGEDPAALQVSDENGRLLPFSVANGNLQIFDDRADTIRIASDSHTREVALAISDVPSQSWTPPASALHTGMPFTAMGPAAADIWKWLAAAGGLGLLLEWVLFGQARKRSLKPGLPQLKSILTRSERPKERMSA